ncbi:MAG TPA: PAC2 family protein [Candidatus Limnocylindrales bacterium]|nr:PAC2 family protein [Candidatus Limnocylindrales bacterium]
MAALYRIDDPGPLRHPALIVALDGWVDAGSAATTAAALIAGDAPAIVTFDADRLFDYRARRPTLDIEDGRLAELTWPVFAIRLVRDAGQDLLVLTGPEPDYRWPRLADAVAEVAMALGVTQWISIGAIPAAVPHTRSVPILGTASEPGLLRGDIRPGPAGLLRVPAALVSVLEMRVAESGIQAVGYFAQVPHYVSGPYAPAALALHGAVARHLGLELDSGDLAGESDQLRTRLDAVTAADENTRSYVERLEAMVDEERLPAGDDLISEIEQFLRDQGSSGRSGS